MSPHATNNPCVTCNVITAPISKVSVRIQLVNAEHSGKCPEDSPQQMYATVIIYQFIPKIQCLIQPCLVYHLEFVSPSTAYFPFLFIHTGSPEEKGAENQATGQEMW